MVPKWRPEASRSLKRWVYRDAKVKKTFFPKISIFGKEVGSKKEHISTTSAVVRRAVHPRRVPFMDATPTPPVHLNGNPSLPLSGKTYNCIYSKLYIFLDCAR